MRKDFLIKVLVFSAFICIFTLDVNAENGLSGIQDRISSLSEKLDVSTIIDFLTLSIADSLKVSVKHFMLCFSLLSVGIVFSSLKDSFGMSENIFDVISSCILIVATSSPILLCFTYTSQHIQALCSLMLSFVPTMIALYCASGSSITAAASAASIPFTVSVLETISSGLILPVTKATMSLCCIGTLIKKTNISSLTAYLKSFCLWVTGLSFTFFTGLLSIQTQLQTGADTLAVKGLKFGASRFIPIAGGMLSDSIKTVISSVTAIKSVAGVAGIVVIIYTVIPPLCVLITTKIFFALLCAFAKSTAQEKAHSFLESATGVLNILLSLTIASSVAFLMVFAIFMKSSITI